MILVDTSVWVDHLRVDDAQLAALLDSSRVLMHPFVLGELACGGESSEPQRSSDPAHGAAADRTGH